MMTRSSLNRSSPGRNAGCLEFLKRPRTLGLTLVGFCLLAVAWPGFALPQRTPATTSTSQPGFELKATTRMVVVDVLAMDYEEQPVNGLTAGDFRVFEKIGKSGKLPETIAAFRAVGRTYGPVALTELLSLPGRSHCWVDAVPAHYVLAYYPSKESQVEGLHHILIKCRHRCNLVYRRSYIMTGVGPAPPVSAKSVADQATDPALANAACGQSPLWAARLHAAYAFTSDKPGRLDYFLALDAAHLTFEHEAKDEYRLGVEYAACAKDAAGNRLYYAQRNLRAVITKEDYEAMKRRGLPFFLGLKKVPDLASIQLVFRDRKSGAMSSVLLVYNQDRPAYSSAGMRLPKAPSQPDARVEDITRGWFGSTHPIAGALCGDVYPLPPGTPVLPDFSELDSIGAVYTDWLNVPSRYSGGVEFDPYSAPIFGINYRGKIWSAQPGKYQFSLTSDDGSKLYVDGRLVIRNDGLHDAQTLYGWVDLTGGWHTIRIAYFQGMPAYLALVLRVKSPNGKWALFDIRNFSSATVQVKGTRLQGVANPHRANSQRP